MNSVATEHKQYKPSCPSPMHLVQWLEDGNYHQDDARTQQGDGPLTLCAADRDGDCTHKACPQLRDGEPKRSGRHCPLDAQHETD